MTTHISCRFSCSECHLKDVLFKARVRDPAEGVVIWFEREVKGVAAVMHQLLAPLCMTRKLSDIKVPFNKDDPEGWIGKYTPDVPPEVK